MGRYYQSWVEGLITGGLDIDANSSTNTRIVVKNYVEDYQGNSVWDGTLTVFQGTFTENSGKYSGPVSKILHIDYNGGNPKTLLEVDMPQGQEPDFSTFQNDFDHAVQLHNDMKAVGLDTDNASFASAQGGTEIVLDNGDGYLIRFTGTNLPTSDIHHPNEIDASATFTKVEKIDPNTNSVVASKDYSASPENARFFVKAVFEPTMIVTDDFLSGDNTITTFNLAFGDGIYIHTGAGTDTVDTATNTPDAFVSIMAEDNQDVIHTGSASNSELDFSAYYSGGQGVSVDLTAAAQNNTITGIRDITGSNYDDALTGDDNSNNLSGGAGDDLIDGAGGWDTVDYSDADTAVNVDLSAGTASDGQGGTDTLINIENVIGSDFDDTITGDANDNIFNGNRGDDTINGGGGNDIFLTSFGNDTFDGGSGTLDTVDYEISNQAVNVDLANHTASDGLGGTDTLQNIEAVIGSPYDDTLTGDGGDNILSGYYGDDTINGGGGADILRGGSGSDVIAGGDDNDRLIGGAGDDRLTGGAGADTFAYDGQLDQNGNPITPDFGNDEITDLDASADKIRLDMFVDDGGSIRPINRNDVDITDDGSGGSYITAKNPAYFSGQIHVRNSDPTTTETAMEFACFPAGTRMLTASGPKAIERLRAGDLLITASGKARPLAFLGVQTIHPHPVHGHAARNLPVRIAAHAFGPGAPARPLITSWWHGIMLQGGWIRRWFGQERIIVPAGRLINGGSIRPLSAAGVITLYNVVLEAHDVVFAEGLSVETFRPLNGNQRDFDNWREFAPFHLPDAELEARYPPCCPVLDSDAEGRFIGQNLHRLAGEQLTAALLWPLQAA